MKKPYIVTIERRDVKSYTVYAENEEDANDMALDLAEDDESIDYPECEVLEIERDWGGCDDGVFVGA